MIEKVKEEKQYCEEEMEPHACPQVSGGKCSHGIVELMGGGEPTKVSLVSH